MIKHVARLILLFSLCIAVHAQVVDIPDPNLRAAIRGELQLPPGVSITKENMLRLENLGAARHDIMHLTGLELATNLRSLSLWGNPLAELTPIADLRRLTYLDVAACSISDITALSNLVNLTGLNVRFNRIVDISPIENLKNLVSLRLEGNRIADVAPLADLTRLTELYLSDNHIPDIRPLANLVELETLDIRGNPVTDYTSLDGLALPNFLYDEFCDLPPLPVRDRIQNRNYPSIFARWSGPGWPPIVNRPELTGIENVASHDLWFSVPQFGLGFRETPDGFTMAGSLEDAIQRRDEFLVINSNMIFLADIRMREYWEDAFPEDWPYWVRDANGEIVSGWPGANLVDFTHPHIQDRIVQQAIAVSKCGLYDGVFFDWWHEGGPVLAGYLDNAAEQRARDNILRRIREATRPDFLIMGNTNDRIIPRTGPHINGGFMETIVPYDKTGATLEQRLNVVEDSLLWLDQNLREPRINGLEGWVIPTEPPDSPANRRWMRVITTLGLTHSDGYVVFTSANDGYHHYWYDFWDADLGQPVGARSQLYEEIPGLYIREYTNGWAVYNHSGQAQEITLPESVTGVASGVEGLMHVIPNLDGEMYLKAVVSDQSPVTSENPADVNGDGVVNILDLTLVAQGFGADKRGIDVNGDGVVNVFDLVFVADQF